MKTRIASRYNRVSERFLTMLAFLAAFLISLSGTRAQSNTEYSFRQQAVADGQAFHSNGDPVPVLTMDCLAANGYGQWTLSSQPGQGGDGSGATTYPAGWYLLPNGLYAPSTHYDAGDLADHPGCIPPGMVQNGQLFGAPVPTDPEATANLNGAETFAWPDPAIGTGGTTREDFLVQGFRVANVDLSLSFLSSPHTPMNIVGTQFMPNVAPTSFPAISTSTGLGTHDVISAGTLEAPTYPDEYSVCSDAAYVYITWCSTKHRTPGVGPSEIWYEVLDINTLAPVLGPASAGSGMRPTIACDPRDNRNVVPTVHFDLAFIAPVNGSFVTIGTLTGGNPVWISYNGGAWAGYPMTANVLRPMGGTNITYAIATHARALVSSVAGGGWYPACYAIVEGFLGDVLSPALILYNLLDPNIPPGLAAYVDGDAMAATGAPVPAPQAPQIGWPVKDGPIVAMANTYDNQNISSNTPSDWQAYDQFHCLYQLDLSGNPGQIGSQKYPLLIVRTSDNAEANPLQPNPIPPVPLPDTRVVLNQVETNPPPPVPILLDTPATYCAAVNQMGIHVHWRTSEGVHFYARDTGRSFDEPIDENTLVTDICTVSDGSATGTNHGGTVGTTIGCNLNCNLTMAIWTDPNYGFSLTDPNSGLYQPRTYGAGTANVKIDSHVGMLNFRGENVKLNVGYSDLRGQYANLTDMPYFYFNFLGANRGNTQGVVVNGTWNYYGLIAVHDPTTAVATLTASPFTNGSLAQDDGPQTYLPSETGGGSIQIGSCGQSGEAGIYDIPGTLIVHSGANFFCGEWTSFTIAPDQFGFSGNIDVMYGGDVFPINNASYSITDTTGMLTLDGKTILNRNEQIGTTDTSTWWASGGCLRGHIPMLSIVDDINRPLYQATGVVLYIGEVWDKTDHPTDLTGIQFDAENFDFLNTSNALYGGGKSELRVDNLDPNYPYNAADNADGGDIVFNNGYADAIEIHMIDPDPVSTGGTPLAPVNYTIENMTFNDLRGETIMIESDQEPDYYYSYGHVSILNNSFGYWTANVGLPVYTNGESYPVSGIYVRNFNSESYYNGGYGSVDQIGPIDIDGNQFLYSNCSSNIDDDDGSAIVLDNTTANVESNKIADAGYPNGIFIRESGLGGNYVVNSYSFICSNIIENLLTSACGYASSKSGIKSRYGAGYVKLNLITNNDVGYSSNFSDEPHLIFDSIFDNFNWQLRSESNSVIDLTGVHGGGNDYGAYNTIYGRSIEDDVPNQFDWIINIVDNTSNVYVGKLINTWSSWGENNLYSTSTHRLQTIIGAYASIDLGNIDHNNWTAPGGAIVDPSQYGSSGCYNCYWTSAGSAGPISAQAYPAPTNTLSYVATALQTRTSFIPMLSPISCGTGWGGGDRAKKIIKSQPLSIETDSSAACTQLYFSGYEFSSNRQWQQAFDTLTHFIETCPNNPNSPHAFSQITSAVAGLYGSDGGSYRATYLAWLESVLYLNTTNLEYFCACVEAIASTLPLTPDTAAGHVSRWTNIRLSVIAWLIRNTTCDTPALAQEYDFTRQDQLEQWANNPTAYKLDTTLPPLDSIQPGLQELLEKHFLYADVSERTGPGILSNASASPNPVSSGTIISFGISKEAYVKIEVFDILGNRVSSAGFESLFEPGNKAVPISLQGLPSGTYFARIVTAYGEVQTVKLVKE